MYRNVSYKLSKYDKKNIRHLRSFFIFIIYFFISNDVFAERPIAKHREFVAYLNESQKCIENMEVVVRHPTPTAFTAERVELQRLLGGVRVSLSMECPQANELIILGKSNNKLIYSGVLSNGTGWVLIDTPSEANIMVSSDAETHDWLGDINDEDMRTTSNIELADESISELNLDNPKQDKLKNESNVDEALPESITLSNKISVDTPIRFNGDSILLLLLRSYPEKITEEIYKSWYSDRQFIERRLWEDSEKFGGANSSNQKTIWNQLERWKPFFYNSPSRTRNRDLGNKYVKYYDDWIIKFKKWNVQRISHIGETLSIHLPVGHFHDRYRPLTVKELFETSSVDEEINNAVIKSTGQDGVMLSNYLDKSSMKSEVSILFIQGFTNNQEIKFNTKSGIHRAEFIVNIGESKLIQYEEKYTKSMRDIFLIHTYPAKLVLKNKKGEVLEEVIY